MFATSGHTKSYRLGAKRAAFPGLWSVFCLLACIGDRPIPCDRQSDCTDSTCSTRGFCQSECSSNSDCPCGSYCATGCGVCIREDNVGPGTCFATLQGLTTTEVMGACLGHLQSAGGAEDCRPSEETLSCVGVGPQPALDAGSSQPVRRIDADAGRLKDAGLPPTGGTRQNDAATDAAFDASEGVGG